MPANPGYIDNIYFFPIRLIGDISYAYAEFFRQFFFNCLVSEFLYIVYANGQHKILRKLNIVKALQDEFASIFLKTDVIAAIPTNSKAQFPEQLFRFFKFFSRWY